MSHWENHPRYPVADWKYEVENDDTRLGYAQWVAARIEQEENDNVRTQEGSQDPVRDGAAS